MNVWREWDLCTLWLKTRVRFDPTGSTNSDFVCFKLTMAVLGRATGCKHVLHPAMGVHPNHTTLGVYTQGP